MQPLIVHDYRPQADITIWTKTGEVYHDEVMADTISCHVSRDVSGRAGVFGLQLTARRDKKGRTWRDKVRPMDYVEIRMGLSRMSNGKLPIRMRGFVDNSMETLVFGPEGGPQRVITINGRDYTKLFMVSNIQYLWTNSLPRQANARTGGALELNYGIPLKICSVKEIVTHIVDNIFNGKGDIQDAFLPGYRKSGIHIPDIHISCTVPDKFSVESVTIQPYTGPFWNLLTYFQSPPIGECFMLDYEDAPVLIYRVCPFKDKNQNYVPPAVDPSTVPGQLAPVEINPSMISQYSLSYSDNEVLNYFFVYSDIAINGGGTQFNYVQTPTGTEAATYQSGSNPYWNEKSTETYGIRPLNVSSPWVTFVQIKNTGYRELAAELATFLGKVFDHNEELLSGAITCHGYEHLVPGRYVIINDKEMVGGRMAFYLEEVTDTFNFKGAPNPGWAAQLGVTRGQLF